MYPSSATTTVFCYHTQPLYDTTPATYTLRVNIFNWSPVPQFTIDDRFTGQIRYGLPPLLEVLNNFGQVFLHASAFPAASEISLTEDSYNSFSPCRDHFNLPGSPGSYTSTMGSVQDYVIYYTITLQERFRVHLSRPYIILTLIYDFMAFTSQTYREYFGSADPTIKSLARIRRAFSSVVLIVKDNAHDIPYVDLPGFRRLMDMFHAISMNALPTPYIVPLFLSSTLSTPSSSRITSKRPPMSDISVSESIIKKPRYYMSGEDTNDITQPQHKMQPSSAAIDLSSTLRPISMDAAKPPSDTDDDVTLKYFSSFPMNKLSTSTSSYIMDSGAGRTGISHLHLLTNVQPNANTTVSGAFGPSIQPTHTGEFGPLGLDAVYIESMGSHTLVSLSQYCRGGKSGKQHIGVFTPQGYRMYDLQSALPALKTLATQAKESERGTVVNRIYMREST